MTLWWLLWWPTWGKSSSPVMRCSYIGQLLLKSNRFSVSTSRPAWADTFTTLYSEYWTITWIRQICLSFQKDGWYRSVNLEEKQLFKPGQTGLVPADPSPGKGQPRISTLMQMLPLVNQDWGLTRMYRATIGVGRMFRTGISFSWLPLKIYWGEHIPPRWWQEILWISAQLTL